MKNILVSKTHRFLKQFKDKLKVFLVKKFTEP